MPGNPVEGIAYLLQYFLWLRKYMKIPFSGSEGIITDFKIPDKIGIGDVSEVSAVYKGSIKSGYFSLMIEDHTGVKQSFVDYNSVKHIVVDSGKKIQTGRLDLLNCEYESKWKFTPLYPLYVGYAKAVVQIFEGSSVFPLAIKEKDIHLY